MFSRSSSQYLLLAAIGVYLQKQPYLPSIATLCIRFQITESELQLLLQNWCGIDLPTFAVRIKATYPKLLLQQQKDIFSSTTDTIFVPTDYIELGQISSKISTLYYSIQTTPVGDMLIACTETAIVWSAFCEDKEQALISLQANFPTASLIYSCTPLMEIAISFFDIQNPPTKKIKLAVKATDFQLQVWQQLLMIPFGETTTYGKIATIVSNVKASRAIGTAVGANPIAFLIPCHRVIAGSGMVGDYRWSSIRKSLLLCWESVIKTT